MMASPLAADPTGQSMEGCKRIPGPVGIFGGVADDYYRRFSRYALSDYTAAFKSDRHFGKALAAALFTWLATLFSTISLAEVVAVETHDRLGTTNYLAANAIFGITHALLGAQPLVVLRPTGPITASLGDIAILADSYQVNFHSLLAATGLFVSSFMIVASMLELSRFIRLLTPFTLDVFAVYVCSIYCYDGIMMELNVWRKPNVTMAEILLSHSLALFTVLSSMFLHYRSPLLSSLDSVPALRQLLADYAIPWTVLLCVIINRIVPIDLDHIDVASNRSQGRAPRFVDFSSADHHTIWPIALLAGLLISIFLFVDHNISSVLGQRRLNRGRYYHSSLLAMGIFNALGPLFLMPFVSGSLPHNPQLAQQLVLTNPVQETTEVANSIEDPAPKVSSPSPETPSSAHSPPQRARRSSSFGDYVFRPGTLEVVENRVTPLVMYALVGLPLLLPKMVQVIPTPAMNGVLFFVGIEGILSTQFFWRLVWHVYCYDSSTSTPYASVPSSTIQLYTGAQLGCYIMCLSMFIASKLTELPLGLAVGVIVCLVVHPINEYLLKPRLSTSQLVALDSFEPADMVTNPIAPTSRPTESSKLLSGGDVTLSSLMSRFTPK